VGRKIKIAAGLVALAIVGGLAALPGIVERQFNGVTGQPLPKVSAEAAALHKTLQIADMHADTLLWGRDILHRSSRGHVDLPRLEEGNVALQVFSSVTKSPKGLNYHANSDKTDSITLLTIAALQPPRTWNSLLERSLWHAWRLQRAERDSAGRLRIVRNGSDVSRLLADRAAGKRVTGAMLSVEGLHDLEGKIGNVQRLYDAGFRMAGIAHFFDNQLGGSKHGMKKGGLTPFGRQVVAEMERRRMIVDVAHSSDQTLGDVLAMATRPVVYSHGGVRATCPNDRTLSDDQLRRIAANGGLIGIGYWDAAVCTLTPDSIAAAIDHARHVAGIDHVALGSDFDGATITLFDTSELVQVTNALLKRGFTADEIRKVMGGNTLAFLERQLPPR
jgi:microsomal dipeptidase-like Zn-dependent dipeptidase